MAYTYEFEVRAFGHILLGFGTFMCCLIWFWFNRDDRVAVDSSIRKVSGHGFRFERIWSLTLFFQMMQSISSISYLQMKFEDGQATKASFAMELISNVSLCALALLSFCFCIEMFCIRARGQATKWFWYYIPALSLGCYVATLVTTYVVSYDTGEMVAFSLAIGAKVLFFSSFIYFAWVIQTSGEFQRKTRALPVMSLVCCEGLQLVSHLCIVAFGREDGWLIGFSVLLHYLIVTNLFDEGICQPLLNLVDISGQGADGGASDGVAGTEMEYVLMAEPDHDDHDDGNSISGSMDLHTLQRDVYTVRYDKTVRGRLRRMFVPVLRVKQEVIKDIPENSNETGIGIGEVELETVILVQPEAFRMLFYFTFICLIGLGYFVSTNFSETFSADENPVILLFGNNNVCIYFDFPPFTYFSAFLYGIIMMFLLAFEALDMIRVLDCYYMDKVFGKCFLSFYISCTIYEVLTIYNFLQIFATQPDVNVYVHVMPFILIIVALWTLALKRYLYFVITRNTNHTIFENHKYIDYLGRLYVIGLGVTIAIKIPFMIINLWGGYLWKRPGYKWTPLLTGTVDQIFTVLVIVVPLFIYYFFGHSVRSLTVKVNRTKIR